MRAALLAGVSVAFSLNAQSPESFRPAADHHGHLQSVAVWELFNAQLPVVTPPADIDRVLHTFEQGWQAADNKVTLSELFTDDGLMQWGDDWIRGRNAIRMMLLGKVGALRLRAQSFASGDSLAYVAGAYGFYRGSEWFDQGRYHFTLRRTNGALRIAIASMGNTTPSARPGSDPYGASHFIADLDRAGIRRGAVLSWAYQFGAAFRSVADEARKVRAENDWTGMEAAKNPARLVAFCSVNPLRDYALAELDACANDRRITGMKLHLTTAFADLRNADHTARLASFFQAANARRLPIVIHLRTMNPSYGREDAQVFLTEVLSKAPDIVVQIAHLAGWGGYDQATDDAVSVFAEAMTAGDRRTTRLYFDVSSVASASLAEGTRELVVRRLRQIGMSRLLFGLDRADVPQGAWTMFARLPLNRTEFRVIANNLAPYLR
jgi:predicted TIM-barrel fold metal-dependent hydrolase